MVFHLRIKDVLLKFLRSAYRDETTSITKLLILKFLFSLKGVAYCAWFYRDRRVGRRLIERYSKTTKKKVFVFANGPSLGDINFEKVKRYQSESHDVIAINSFSSKAIEKFGVIPDFCVFGDPYHYESEKKITDQALDDIDAVNKRCIVSFVPMHLCSKSRFLKSVPFCSSSNPYAKNVTDCSKPLGYYPVTAFYALSIAISLGYEEIFVCGFDNSYFLDFSVDIDGRKYFIDKHFYEEAPIKRYIDPSWFPNSSHVFLNFCRHFGYLEKIGRSRVLIKNVAKLTYTDAFIRCLSLDIYK